MRTGGIETTALGEDKTISKRLQRAFWVFTLFTVLCWLRHATFISHFILCPQLTLPGE